VLAEDDVEGVVVERECRDVGREDLDPVAEPDGVVQPPGDLAVLGREVDRRDTVAATCSSGCIAFSPW